MHLYAHVCVCVCVCWVISLIHMWQGGFPTFSLVYIKTSFTTVCSLWWIQFCIVMCWIMNELTYLPKCKITPFFQQSLIFRRSKYSCYLGFYINICMVNSIYESSIRVKILEYYVRIKLQTHCRVNYSLPALSSLEEEFSNDLPTAECRPLFHSHDFTHSTF